MSYRKMTDHDIKFVVAFIENRADRGNPITWKLIEESSRFTRQALQAHPVIKTAYLKAKQEISDLKEQNANKDVLLNVAPSELADEIKVLRKRIEVLEQQQVLWRRRWYCIAYHIRNRGIQMSSIDKPVPLGQPPLTMKEINSTLEAYHQDIPPVATYRDD